MFLFFLSEDPCERKLECSVSLTLKTPITTAADDIHKYFFIVVQRKIRLDVSSESSARQRIHMKNQTLFSSKDKSKKLKCCLLHFLFQIGTLRVNMKWKADVTNKCQPSFHINRILICIVNISEIVHK